MGICLHAIVEAESDSGRSWFEVARVEFQKLTGIRAAFSEAYEAAGHFYATWPENCSFSSEEIEDAENKHWLSGQDTMAAIQRYGVEVRKEQDEPNPVSVKSPQADALAAILTALASHGWTCRVLFRWS